MDASPLSLQPIGPSVRRRRTCSVVSSSCALWRFSSMFNNASNKFSAHQRSPPRPSSRVARTVNIDRHRRRRPRPLFLVKDDFIVFNPRPSFVLIIRYWCLKPIFVLLFDRFRIGWRVCFVLDQIQLFVFSGTASLLSYQPNARKERSGHAWLRRIFLSLSFFTSRRGCASKE